MAEKVAFELVAPERVLVSEDVDMVVVPGEEGDFGVLPQHAPLVSLVRPGVLRVFMGDQITRRIFVAGGFASVDERGVTVLVEEAEPVEELDLEAARQRLQELEEDLADAKTEEERQRLERLVTIARARAEAAERPDL